MLMIELRCHWVIILNNLHKFSSTSTLSITLSGFWRSMTSRTNRPVSCTRTSREWRRTNILSEHFCSFPSRNRWIAKAHETISSIVCVFLAKQICSGAARTFSSPALKRRQQRWDGRWSLWPSTNTYRYLASMLDTLLHVISSYSNFPLWEYFPRKYKLYFLKKDREEKWPFWNCRTSSVASCMMSLARIDR